MDVVDKFGNITVINDDCMNVLRALPDNAFDLAIVDPPYYSGPERRCFYGSEVSTVGVSRKFYPKSRKWIVPGNEYFLELERIAKHYIVWGCNYFNHTFAPGRIVWDKCNQSSTFSDCELAATDLFTSVRLFRYMWNGMMQGKSINEGWIMQGNKKLNEKRVHPTQKPIALYAWLLNNYAKPGDRILDTHLGSGSSMIAAWTLGFEFTGIEIDPVYYETAVNRFRQHICQGRLF